ncbi:MAG: pilus assembly protein porin PapC [Proteobacteria bacterium]|nr:pilus assembly protein porin PapC [Pseudomonadota bacterium]
MSHSHEFRLNILALCIMLSWGGVVHSEEFIFDSSLLQGSSWNMDLDQFNNSGIISGSYLADVYVNNTLVKSGEKVVFNAEAANAPPQPCLTSSLMRAANLKGIPEQNRESACHPLTYWAKGASWQFDQASLRLQLFIPMTELVQTPRGYIPVSEWDDGMFALFLRHNTRYTWTENTNSNYHYQYLWSGINGGVNLGLWQARHQGNLRYANSSLSGNAYHYNAVRTWVQRPIEKLDSELYLGDNYTDSSLFGSLSFNGIKLATDERMWPQGKRGYAPQVQGIATSTARVIVKQLNQVIYETSVPPGPFVINDLYNTRSQGDLEVEVIEADGKTSSFIVPYSAVPDSVRPGNWNYSLSLGRVRQYYDINNTFFEGVLQHGVSNMLTSNLGVRIAQNYQAFLAGGVLATDFGALGMNTTWSQARVENGRQQQGWRAEVSYSKTFTSGTNLVLAAYRYSTGGFRDLQDVLGVRRQEQDGTVYYSDSLHQRNRLSATISQPLDTWGVLNMSASTADYYNNQSRITQLQLGYSNQWKRISYGINIARQRTTWDYGRFYTSVNDPVYNNSLQKYTENTISFNVSVPLDWGSNLASVAYNYNQSRSSRSSTMSLTGTAGENRDVSYSLYGGYERYRDTASGSAATFGGTLQENTRIGAIQASYDQGESYRQAGLGASGTAVLHRGGLTLGPYTSDTFALIHADGAQGAHIQNGQGAVIDHFGYAILPSLSPYSSNNVSLDARNMNADAELKGGSKRVVPYAGAIVQVDFATLRGKAVLITLKTQEGNVPPMGAEVRDTEGTLIGMVGQGGQIYARVPNNSGVLLVSWGKTHSQQCRVPYQITGRDAEALVHLSQTCEQEK